MNVIYNYNIIKHELDPSLEDVEIPYTKLLHDLY